MGTSLNFLKFKGLERGDFFPALDFVSALVRGVAVLALFAMLML